MTWWFGDGGNEFQQVRNLADLERKLTEAIAAQPYPKVYILSQELGGLMYIGLAGDHGYLHYQPNSDDEFPDEFITVDPAAPADGRTLGFDLAGHESERQLRNLLPVDVVARVAMEFFQTGQRPQSVEWEDVWAENETGDV